MKCPKCGHTFKPGQPQRARRYCSACGKPLHNNEHDLCGLCLTSGYEADSLFDPEEL